jgi:hypothetical protein
VLSCSNGSAARQRKRSPDAAASGALILDRRIPQHRYQLRTRSSAHKTSGTADVGVPYSWNVHGAIPLIAMSERTTTKIIGLSVSGIFIMMLMLNAFAS